MNKYTVYWINLPHYTDPYKEGYIGITSNLEKRKKAHKNSNNKHVKHGLNLGASFEIVADNLLKNEALLIEETYRPYECIGWNLNKGGDDPPSQKGNSNKNRKTLLTADKRTEKQKQAAIIHSRKMKNNTCRTKIPCTLFGKDYNSGKEAMQELQLSINAFYALKELSNKFSSIEEFKQYRKNNQLKARFQFTNGGI